MVPTECVKIFVRPPTNFEEIAILTSALKKRSIFDTQEKMDELLKTLKEDAAQLGANGILIDQFGDIGVGGKASGVQFGHIGTAGNFSAFETVNYDPKIYKTIRAMAIYCPGLDESIIAEALSSSDRESVIQTLKRLRNEKYKWAANLILPCLKSGDSHVLRETCRTLSAIGTTNQASAVECLLSNTETDVVIDSCRTLIRLDSKSSLPKTSILLKSANADIVCIACEAIGTLGNESDTPSLEALLNDKRRSVRNAAKKAIKELGKKR